MNKIDLIIDALECASPTIKGVMYPAGYHMKLAQALVAARELKALAQEQNKCPRCGEVNPAEIHTCSPQVAQEPVAWMLPDYGDVLSASEADGTGIYNIPLYTAPPKQWVGLTEWERNYYNNRLSGSGVAEDIEFELRSRNEKN